MLPVSELAACGSLTEVSPSVEGDYVRMVGPEGQAREWTLELGSGGTFSAGLTSGSAGIETGTWSRDENRMRIYFVQQAACVNDEGVYQYTVAGDRLTLVAAFEPCTPRRRALEGTWVRGRR
jgi:ABC-type cobalamin transport system ATPase subunit